MIASALVSCNKSELPPVPEINQENNGKTSVTIRFDTPSASTKALTQAEEDKINSLSVALYAVTGSTTKLEGYYTFSPTATQGQIYIDESKNPDRYIVAAYANHPTLSLATVSQDWTLFKDEAVGDFQMFAKWEGTESEILAGPVTLQLNRQCSKVTVNKISLDWINPANANKEFLVKDIFLMDVEGAFENLSTYSGQTAWFNMNGYESNDQDEFLYTSVSNAKVTQSAPYTVSHEFYGYISDLTNVNTSSTWAKGASRLVIKASFDGRDCYYAVKINRNNLTRIRNTHFVFNNIKITKPGSDHPYSELIDETAVRVDFSVKPWTTQTFDSITVE